MMSSRGLKGWTRGWSGDLGETAGASCREGLWAGTGQARSRN